MRFWFFYKQIGMVRCQNRIDQVQLFLASQIRTLLGNNLTKVLSENFLFDISMIKDNDEFAEILGYINTKD